MKYVLLKCGPSSFAQAFLARRAVLAAGAHTKKHVSSPAWYPYLHRYTHTPDSSLLGYVSNVLYRAAHALGSTRIAGRIHDALVRILTTLHARETHYALRGLIELPLSTETPTTYIVGTVVRARAYVDTTSDALREAYRLTAREDAGITTFLKANVPEGKIAIGIYLRQTPFAGFPDGAFLTSTEEVLTTLSAYLTHHSLTSEDIVVLTASDIPLTALGTYVVRPITGDEVTQIHTLARTQVVISSNNLEGYVAAWLGDVPLIRASHTPTLPTESCFRDIQEITGAQGSVLTDAERRTIAAALQNQSH